MDGKSVLFGFNEGDGSLTKNVELCSDILCHKIIEKVVASSKHPQSASFIEVTKSIARQGHGICLFDFFSGDV